MRKRFKLAGCAALAISAAAFAGGDKHQLGMNPPEEEAGTGGSGAVQVDPKVMKEMKLMKDQAMTKHKTWIDQHIQAWPQLTREVAAVTIEKLGPPQGVTPTLLTWGAKGGWKRTLLHKEPVDHAFPMPHKDVLQQFVDFKVPTDKFDELATFDGSVVADRTQGELSARCDKEEANFLAINLAADVANGSKSPEQARDYYAKAIKGMLEGEKDPYLSGLKIDAGKGSTADADKKRFDNPMMKMQGRNAQNR